jgi:16S rRNA (adenine(1408)-N(1))-methyltransferase
LGRLALERAPGALEGLADRVSVLLPWGSLLRAVAGADPEGLHRLRGLCAPGATVEVVVSEADLDGASLEALAQLYAEAGLAMAARPAGAGEVAALGTTWAKRLARSDPGRRFVRLAGTAAPAPAAATPGSAPRRGS